MLETNIRTHTCGELRLKHAGETVRLGGWVQRIRNKGSMLWIDLRDRYGTTQLACEKGRTTAAIFEQAQHLGREDVVQIHGEVKVREAINRTLPTGEIEVFIAQLDILSASALPPFLIEDHTDGAERLRMQYRYLDLRRPGMQANFMFRHRVTREIRAYLDAQHFLEIETPHLIKSTPEGARDFLVPSRMHKGEFYALPQSPQTFKQLLMVSGFDRYYQLARCFRDEDLRADRQPEFTQLDLELSFVTREDILQLFEALMVHLFSVLKGVSLGSFPRLSYAEAMARYGSDKPDLRLGMEIADMDALGLSYKGQGFRLFDETPAVRLLCAKNTAQLTRKQLDALTTIVREAGGQALIYLRVEREEGTEKVCLRSSVDKFYDHGILQTWVHAMGATVGDMLFLVPGEGMQASQALGALRLVLGKEVLEVQKKIQHTTPEKQHKQQSQRNTRSTEELSDRNAGEEENVQALFKPLWVYDFPLLEYNEEEKRFQALHHPFTAPCMESLDSLETAPERVLAQSYDLVINGVEIAGGSIRIASAELQKKIFMCLGFSEAEAEEQFGFLMNAFRYGVPPHGGIAMGFDRLCALLQDKDSIREMIAFPKSANGRDPMLGAPSPLPKTPS